jgi:hypothetical protein
MSPDGVMAVACVSTAPGKSNEVVFVDVWAKARATERILRIKTTGILDLMTSTPSANG